jgi:hypothetical protein
MKLSGTFTLDLERLSTDELSEIQKEIARELNSRNAVFFINSLYVKDKENYRAYNFERLYDTHPIRDSEHGVCHTWACDLILRLKQPDGSFRCYSGNGVGINKKSAKEIASLEVRKKIFFQRFDSIEFVEFDNSEDDEEDDDRIKIYFSQSEDERYAESKYCESSDQSESEYSDKCENEENSTCDDDSPSDPDWFPEWKSMDDKTKKETLDQELNTICSERKNVSHPMEPWEKYISTPHHTPKKMDLSKVENNEETAETSFESTVGNPLLPIESDDEWEKECGEEM